MILDIHKITTAYFYIKYLTYTLMKQTTVKMQLTYTYLRNLKVRQVPLKGKIHTRLFPGQ